MLLNTVQGLLSVDTLKLELLRAYAAKPAEVFFKLRLPNALPYLFNALKLAVVLSVVSVIVAEFLIPGPPEGLGQRISLSARRGRSMWCSRRFSSRAWSLSRSTTLWRGVNAARPAGTRRFGRTEFDWMLRTGGYGVPCPDRYALGRLLQMARARPSAQRLSRSRLKNVSIRPSDCNMSARPATL